MILQPLQKLEQTLTSTKLDEPIVLCAADENYIKPLAVTLFSAASTLRPGSHLQVLLFDGGISPSSWQGLKETLVDLPISVHVLRPNRAEVADLGISHHITHTAYFRLLAARLLPKSLDKVIYLDSDVLLRSDITELWRLEVEPHYCLAATDIACPFVDARYADPKYHSAIPYLAAIAPIPNWKQLRLNPLSGYFNSGVMVLNLRRWRDEQIEVALLKCLRDNAKYVWCWDQYALNVIFSENWKPLPSRWNQGAHVFEYPSKSYSPVEVSEYLAMRDDPALIHFTTEFKPWLYRPYHPLRELWYQTLDQTAWASWRPAMPEFRLSDWWTRQAVKWSRQWIVNYRKLRSVFPHRLAVPTLPPQ
jgi:lipopolysaccharide biosynthesis glycosyltransferase